MLTTTEMKINFPFGRITKADIMPDGSCDLTIEVDSNLVQKLKEKEETFTLIEASKLSTKDKFMQYEPKSEEEKELKKNLLKQIKRRNKDFYCSRYIPSIDQNNKICYDSESESIENKDYDWWEENARKFDPKRNSRLGTNDEYIAYLGVMIKELHEIGYTLEEAWKNVSKNSRSLGYSWIAYNGCMYFKKINLSSNLVDVKFNNPAKSVGWIILEK